MTANAFLAFDLTDRTRHDIAASLDMASPGPVIPGRRVPPANWHVTVRFLGPIDDVSIDLVSKELDGGIPVAPGKAYCTGLGAFPRPSRATVIHVGIEDRAGILASVAAHCEEACRDAGLAPEERPYVPHVTLARVRPPRDVRSLFRTFGDFSVPVPVDAVSLFRSMPEGRRVTYEELDRFPLIG